MQCRIGKYSRGTDRKLEFAGEIVGRIYEKIAGGGSQAAMSLGTNECKLRK